MDRSTSYSGDEYNPNRKRPYGGESPVLFSTPESPPAKKRRCGEGASQQLPTVGPPTHNPFLTRDPNDTFEDSFRSGSSGINTSWKDYSTQDSSGLDDSSFDDVRRPRSDVAHAAFPRAHRLDDENVVSGAFGGSGIDSDIPADDNTQLPLATSSPRRAGPFGNRPGPMYVQNPVINQRLDDLPPTDNYRGVSDYSAPEATFLTHDEFLRRSREEGHPPRRTF